AAERPSAASKPSIGSARSTTSRRRYGWPFTDRVDSALARLDTAASMRVRSTESALAAALMAELRVATGLLALADGVAHQLELGGERRLRGGEVAVGALHRQQLAIQFHRVAVAAGHRVLDLAHPGRVRVGGVDVVRARGRHLELALERVGEAGLHRLVVGRVHVGQVAGGGHLAGDRLGHLLAERFDEGGVINRVHGLLPLCCATVQDGGAGADADVAPVCQWHRNRNARAAACTKTKRETCRRTVDRQNGRGPGEYPSTGETLGSTAPRWARPLLKSVTALRRPRTPVRQ